MLHSCNGNLSCVGDQVALEANHTRRAAWQSRDHCNASQTREVQKGAESVPYASCIRSQGKRQSLHVLHAVPAGSTEGNHEATIAEPVGSVWEKGLVRDVFRRVEDHDRLGHPAEALRLELKCYGASLAARADGGAIQRGHSG